MAAGATDHLREVLAPNLRLRRVELGLSQEPLGDEAGLHRTFIGAVERSETNISLDNLERLAARSCQPSILSAANPDKFAIVLVGRGSDHLLSSELPQAH